jgi:hypothetical protein
MVALLLLGLVMLLAWFVPSGSNVDRETFAFVKEGMTEREVERFFGGPAHLYVQCCVLGAGPSDTMIAAYWFGPNETILVDFFNGKVVSRIMFPAGNVEMSSSFWSFQRRILRMFGL